MRCNAFPDTGGRSHDTTNTWNNQTVTAFVSVMEQRGFRQKESLMSSTTDKAKGMANEGVGNIKQGVGKAIDNKEMQAKGAMQERKGEAQQAVGNAKDAVKKVIDKA
jgi:uncharacterized protein YjbJ (UPF0337 family)